MAHWTVTGTGSLLRPISPLSDDEIVEWTVSNGQDANGTPVNFLRKQGSDSHRIFLKQMDKDTPLDISAKIRSDCGISSKGSISEKEGFRPRKPRIIGPTYIEALTPVSFHTCPVPNNNQSLQWGSSGTVLLESPGLVSVLFTEEGPGFVEISIANCDGTQTIVKKSLVAGKPGKKARAGHGIEVQNGKFFKVFPNPSLIGHLNVQLVQETAEGHVELVSMQGQTMAVKPIAGSLVALDTSNVPSGFYLLRITTANHEATERVGINLH